MLQLCRAREIRKSFVLVSLWLRVLSIGRPGSHCSCDRQFTVGSIGEPAGCALSVRNMYGGASRVQHLINLVPGRRDLPGDNRHCRRWKTLRTMKNEYPRLKDVLNKGESWPTSTTNRGLCQLYTFHTSRPTSGIDHNTSISPAIVPQLLRLTLDGGQRSVGLGAAPSFSEPLVPHSNFHPYPP